jgi:putative ABC transport system permease protein
MLFYLYRRRLRVHAVQELLAGAGVAVAVALLFAVTLASTSVTGSASQVLRAVAGPANLQLRARSADGMDGRLLPQVEALPGVAQAAPLLEENATVIGPGGRRAPVLLAGVDAGLVLLDGLAHTLPRSTFSASGIGLSSATAAAVGVDPRATRYVSLELRGRIIRLGVTAVLGPGAVGMLANAPVSVMPLAGLQRLAGLPGRVTRIVLLTRPGQTAAVRARLLALFGAHLTLATAGEDIALLRQALGPSDQSSKFFAAISVLLGFLLAFNTMLLTVPERREAISDLRLLGVQRSSIVGMVFFQALCLGIVASLAGLLGGYALAISAFHESPGYLAEAFTLGEGTVVGAGPVLLAFGGGVLATCLAATVPLLDLRHGGAPLESTRDVDGTSGDPLGRRAQLWFSLAAAGVLAFATAAFALLPALALAALSVLALAAVLAVPPVLGALLRASGALAGRYRLGNVAVVLLSLRGSTLRSLALAGTGAVALFGSVALGGARSDLLHGLARFSHAYTADAGIWVNPPGANQATVDFLPGADAARIARVPGVVRVRSFFGGYLDFGGRRVWIIARPPGAQREVLASQIVAGNASAALARLGGTGWVAVSAQIAAAHHLGVGGTLTLPTPSGDARFKIAATTTNLGWSPGVVFIGAGDYRAHWATSSPTALGVELAPGASATRTRGEIVRALGPASGLEVSTASARAASIDALAGAGLSRLGEISALLLLAAILTLSAALSSAIWQRRRTLAQLRLSGATPRRLRGMLLVESALLVSAGCLTGALAGLYGQVMIDVYLKHVTGFPLATITTGMRPLELLALVLAAALAVVAAPGWLAARVPPTSALGE